MPRILGINVAKIEYTKNRFINGDFGIWQRGSAFSNPNSLDFNADRWTIETDGTLGSHSITRQLFTNGQTEVPNTPKYFLRWGHGTAGSGSTFIRILQRIEDVRTFAGKQITVSFYARTVGAASIAVGYRQYFGTGGSPSAFVENNNVGSVTLTANFQRYSVTFTVPSITGKTIGTSNTHSLAIKLHIPNNAVVTIDFANIMVNEGPVAAPFVTLGSSPEEELAACQRFYEKTDDIDTAPGTNNRFYTGQLNAGGSGGHGPIVYKVQKIIIPNIAYWNNGIFNQAFWRRGSIDATSQITQNQPTVIGFDALNVTLGSAGQTSQLAFAWAADAEI